MMKKGQIMVKISHRLETYFTNEFQFLFLDQFADFYCD